MPIKSESNYSSTAFLTFAAPVAFPMTIHTMKELSEEMTKRLCIIAGAAIFLSMGGIATRGEAETIIIPDVGEGQCVKPGPDGKPQPCGKENQQNLSTTPRTIRRPRTPSQSSISPPRSNLPCNQIPWENDQKRQCAERVQKDCKKLFAEGTKEFQECVFKGLTGEGKTKTTKVQALKKEKVKEKRGQQSSPTTPSSRKQPKVIKVPASQAPTSPPPSRSQPVLPEEETTPPSPPPSPSPSQEQCIFPFSPDCRSKCQGLPSYPTFEFEDCLTRCDQTYQAALEEYNRCQEKQR